MNNYQSLSFQQMLLPHTIGAGRGMKTGRLAHVLNAVVARIQRLLDDCHLYRRNDRPTTSPVNWGRLRFWWEFNIA